MRRHQLVDCSAATFRTCRATHPRLNPAAYAANQANEERRRRKVTVAGSRPRIRTRFEGDGAGGQSTNVMRKPVSRLGLVCDGPNACEAKIPSLADLLKLFDMESNSNPEPPNNAPSGWGVVFMMSSGALRTATKI